MGQSLYLAGVTGTDLVGDLPILIFRAGGSMTFSLWQQQQQHHRMRPKSTNGIGERYHQGKGKSSHIGCDEDGSDGIVKVCDSGGSGSNRGLSSISLGGLLLGSSGGLFLTMSDGHLESGGQIGLQLGGYLQIACGMCVTFFTIFGCGIWPIGGTCVGTLT